jgi:hypothetical protein
MMPLLLRMGNSVRTPDWVMVRKVAGCTVRLTFAMEARQNPVWDMSLPIWFGFQMSTI